MHPRRPAHSLTASGKVRKEVALPQENSPLSNAEYTLSVPQTQHFLMGAN